MSDTDENDQHDDVDTGLEISDEDAERLLSDAVDTDDDADDGEDQAPGDSRLKRSDTELDKLRDEATKWRSLARKHERSAKETSAKLRKYEDQNKSEAQRLQEAAEEHRTRAEKAESALRRREIAEERAPAHATLAQIKAVAKRLSGDELFGLLVPAPPKASTPGRPKERLRPGNADPEEGETETDPRKLADMVRRNR
jgi:hypothetical protein